MDNSNDRVGYFSHAIDRLDLQPGDHIYVWRQLGTYSHHGIYTRSGKVIHLSGARGQSKSKSTARVRESTLDEFLDGNQLRLVAYGVKSSTREIKRKGTCHVRSSRSVEKILETAEYYLQNPHQWDSYHLINNNCEHFAYYCKTGIKRSAQIDSITQPLTST